MKMMRRNCVLVYAILAFMAHLSIEYRVTLQGWHNRCYANCASWKPDRFWEGNITSNTYSNAYVRFSCICFFKCVKMRCETCDVEVLRQKSMWNMHWDFCLVFLKFFVRLYGTQLIILYVKQSLCTQLLITAVFHCSQMHRKWAVCKIEVINACFLPVL